MCYDPHEACLCVVGNKPLVNRLDLYKGCFRQSYQLRGTQSFDVKYDYNLELLYAATDIGIQAIDQRTDKPIGCLPTSVPASTVETSKNSVAVGTQDGEVLIFDVRSNVPLQKLSHHQLPVKQI